MELNKLRLSQIDTSDIETSDFASQTQINTVQSNLDSYASYANSTFSTGDGVATGNGVVFSTSITTDASNTYNLIVTSNGAGDYDIVSGSDRASVLTGSQDPNVYIEEGDVISITNNASGHPLYIKYNSSTGTGDAVSGVTNQGADGGTTLTWDTSIGDAGTYFYQCSNHLAMNGYLIVQSSGTYTSDQYYTLSNTFTLPQSVEYKENLLVYLNGLLQHPDAYSVSATDLTLANTDPLPKNMKIAIRELAVAGGLANVSLANVAEARASNAANGTLTFDYEGSNLYIYDGTVAGGYYLPLTQAVVPVPDAQWYQGSSYGYASGGLTSPSGKTNSIDKYAMASSGDSTSIGTLTVSAYGRATSSSDSYGYGMGGSTAPPFTGWRNDINKFPFVSDANATDVGDIGPVAAGYVSPSFSTSMAYGYGGRTPQATSTNYWYKFPFASDVNSTNATMTGVPGIYGSVGHTGSNDYGYISGGHPGITNIWKTSHVSENGSFASTGSLTSAISREAGFSSSTTAYSVDITYFHKFPFTSDVNATDLGTSSSLTVARGVGGSSSAPDYGYHHGGTSPSYTNIIDRYPFASEDTATDVGDLTSVRRESSNYQNV